MIGESGTAGQVKDGKKGLKQKLFEKESAIKNILSKKLSTHHTAEYLGLPGINPLVTSRPYRDAVSFLTSFFSNRRSSSLRQPKLDSFFSPARGWTQLYSYQFTASYCHK